MMDTKYKFVELLFYNSIFNTDTFLSNVFMNIVRNEVVKIVLFEIFSRQLYLNLSPLV